MKTIIEFTGPSGSGKTYYSKQIEKTFLQNNAIVLNSENFRAKNYKLFTLRYFIRTLVFSFYLKPNSFKDFKIVFKRLNNLILKYHISGKYDLLITDVGLIQTIRLISKRVKLNSNDYLPSFLSKFIFSYKHITFQLIASEEIIIKNRTERYALRDQRYLNKRKYDLGSTNSKNIPEKRIQDIKKIIRELRIVGLYYKHYICNVADQNTLYKFIKKEMFIDNFDN